ncbi:MAG: triple tyrosine motif-containing protein [Balneolaceae bacterium]|nr:triple tyrosine motif-containing protein [Balneolaceae bacterium]
MKERNGTMFIRLLIPFLLILSTGFQAAKAQISYQVSNYTANEAGAGNQNWDITTNDSGSILIANNNGLLIFENSTFTLHELPGSTVFRSVAYINGKIYTGSFEDFGYWEENKAGELQYHSLADRLDNSDLNNDEIWKIVEHQNKIYFHSFGSIYCYDEENADVYRLDAPGSFMFLYKIGDNVYTQQVQGGLRRLENDDFLPIPGSEFLSQEEVASIIRLHENSMLIGTSGGMYTFDGSTFEDWQAERVDEVIQNRINTIVRTDDKIIIGTILNGIYIYDLEFNFIENINTRNQLQNNTVLSLHTDTFGNVWVGMDKGISYIAFDTPIHPYREEPDDIGSVYAAALYNNELYIGTNRGIYWYNRDENGNFFDKSLIPDSQGQVWFLKVFDGKLYSGLNDGTYVIENKELVRVSSVHGGYNLKPYPGNNRNLLLQSTYSNLVVYQKDDDVWREAYLMSGFQSPSRFLEFDHLGNIWLGHTIRGIFRLQPNIQFNRIDQIQEIGIEDGLPQSTNLVFKMNNQIMTSIADTLYQWDAINETFVPYNDLNDFFTVTESVSNIIPAGGQRYWIIKESEILLVEIYFNSITLVYRILPQMYDFKLVDGYENIIPLNENLHLISLEDGFAVLNLDLVNEIQDQSPEVELYSVATINSQQRASAIDPDVSSETVFSNQNNSVRFNWSTTQVAGNRAFFQYKLDGINTNWSDWTTNTQADYLRLPSGDYTFSVRSIESNGQLTEPVTFSFTIEEPWYLSPAAFFLYIILLISFVLMIRFYISRRRWKKLGKELEKNQKKIIEDREKAEKEVIKLSNEKLQNEIEHKSAQLASSTMAMMRKNNLLSSIKDELQNQKEKLGDRLPDKSYNKLIKLIEDGIEDEHEWEIFEQLYNEAHGNFFKRLKEEYPQLTPSDLRLCAYLRMNLSSKEIAPLLNISVRGVEERRYRLRKRLDLSTDQNLTELIMTF